ncbi:sulfotransferase domain-containing protein [Xanthomarina gelatinilytica]|uniref:sulfotransferase domain-containing protein n=1 Tax=Xanthomarina gelatinilytica TaxID=1137281 RepID=UPI003AA7AFD8
MNKFKHKIKQVLKFEERIAQQTENMMRQNNFLPISETKPQDIFIAGFPKSGNTWMQNLIAGLQFNIETATLPDTLTQELVPDVHSKEFYKRFYDVVFFKTHGLPRREMKRVIHLVRDGRDAMASYFAMNQAMKKQVTLEEMIIDGKAIYPCRWHEHTQKWLDNPYDAEIITIKYEDLINDTLTELKKIIAFAKLNCSDYLINKVIEGNSFAQMKNKEKLFGWNNKNWDSSKDFIRKGQIESYKEEIPNELILAFENYSKNQLQHFNYQCHG